MTSQVHRTMLINAFYRDAALDLIAAAAGEDQRGMLITPVSTQSEEPTTTHYMSAGNILETFANILPLDEWDDEIEEYVRIIEPNYAVIIAISNNTITEEQLITVFNNAIITTESWQDTLGKLNLSIDA